MNAYIGQHLIRSEDEWDARGYRGFLLGAFVGAILLFVLASVRAHQLLTNQEIALKTETAQVQQKLDSADACVGSFLMRSADGKGFVCESVEQARKQLLRNVR